ncbi:MAG TPA: ATP-binding protein [Rhizomicrobium sp.]|nr:ATP-binding protein [Rhizomicrobium sp.]
MSFRTRLALFLAVTLVAVQALTAAVGYFYLRHNLVERGKRELAGEMGVFTRQLDFLSERVTDAVKVSSLDYALRSAIAQHNRPTELSALRNHSQRIGASRMMLVGLDGSLEVDTAAPGRLGGRFRFPELLGSAAVNDKAASLVAAGGHIYWLVAVPVRAPIPIGFIAAFIPVDNALLAHLRALSAESRSIVLAVGHGQGRWQPAARSGMDASVPVSPLAPKGGSTASGETMQGGHHFLTAMSRLETAKGSAPVAAMISYPLDEALGAYRTLLLPLLLLFALALLAAVTGTMVVVRGLSRPLEALAAAARRIAAGDYTPPPKLSQRDEVGHLSDALNHMAHSIADREAALRHAVDAAELARKEAVHAYKAKSQFLANTSHELRTPLNAILGFSEMVEQQIMGAISPRYVDYARNIRESAGKLLGMVERMLDLSDVEGERLHLVRRGVRPGGAIREVLSALLPYAEERRVTLVMPPAVPEQLEMQGDPERLKQAFTNIVHNAIKFTAAGGEVRVTCTADSDAIFISVSDTGIGIEPELLASVVRPFQRLRSALDGQHQGAGLGLPFAKAIIELHGGQLRLQSTLGAGTTVHISLPARMTVVNQAA